MTVRIDPRKLFEGDNDLRQYLKIAIDLEKLFNLADNQRVDSRGKIHDIEMQSMVISLIEEALPKFIEVELYEEE